VPGGKLQQTKRLNNIITYANDNSVRTYDLEYQYYGTPKKSQLTSIQECTNNGQLMALLLASVILFTAQSLTMDLPCASILESSVLPYSKVCPLLVLLCHQVSVA
jgi:hypothetical protein